MLHREQSTRQLLRESVSQRVRSPETDALREATRPAACRVCDAPTDEPSLEHDSVYLFSGTNPFRIFMLNVCQSKPFEAVVMLVILSNTVFLALEDPRATEEPSYAYPLELAYVAAFTLEMLWKMLAYGVVMHEGSYLRDPWNRLDFVIVLLMYLAFIPGFGSYTAFRAMRVLRPLRSMNAVAGLKALVVGLFYSIGGLLNVILLSTFIFLIFAVLGVQLWMGLFRQQCRSDITGALSDVRCSTDPGSYDLTGRGCPANFTCVEGSNPHYGFMNFDDTRWAVLSVFQVMTFEGWPELLLITFRVYGAASFVYFFFLVLIASYFVPNLALAVINDKYHEAQEKLAEQEDERAAHEAEAQRLREVDELNVRIGLMNTSGRDGDGSFAHESSMENIKVMNSPTQPSQHLGLPVFGPRTNITVRSEGSAITVLSDPNSPVQSPFSGTPQATVLMLEGNPVDTSPPPRPVSAWEALRNALHLITQGCPLPAETRVDADPLDFEGDGDAGVPETQQKLTPFVAFVIVCIGLNTLVLAAQHHNQPQWLTDVSTIANYAFTAIFAVEVTVVMIAIGFKRYFTDAMLVLDLVIVLLSIAEIFFTGGGVVSVFRALRLLRVLKLLRNFPSLRVLVRVIFGAVADSLYLNVIMLLFLVIMALTGKQLFGGTLVGTASEDGRAMRTTFKDFYASFLTVFQVVTTDGWVDVMWKTMERNGPHACLFFIAVVLMGTYVILNLFLSILITGFDRQASAETDFADADFDEGRAGEMLALQRVVDKHIARQNNVDESAALMHEKGDHGAKLCRISTQARAVLDIHPNNGHSMSASHHSGLPPGASMRNSRRATVFESTLRGFEAPGRCNRCHTQIQEVLPAFPGELSVEPMELHRAHCFAAHLRMNKTGILDTLEAYSRRMRDVGAPVNALQRETVVGQARANGMLLHVDERRLEDWEDVLDELQEQRDILELCVGEEQVGRSLLGYVTSGLPKTYTTNGGVSLFCLGPDNALRVALYRFVKHPAFDNTILVLIILSSLLLVLDNPRNEEGTMLSRVVQWSNIAFAVIFLFEMVCKVTAFGLVGPQKAYLRSGWNWLDGIIVLISIAAIFIGNSVGSLRAFRTLRALRPLRAINRNRGLKVIVRTLLESIRGIAHVALLSLLNYLIFGILAVQILGGRLYSCNDGTVTTQAACTGSYVDATSNQTFTRLWQNQDRHYDNVLNSMLTLFQVSSGDDWGFVMYDAIDAVGVGQAPQQDAHPEMGLFFVVFFVIGNLFMLNLFVGVVIFNFNNVKDQMDGLSLLTEEQKQWVEAQHMMLNFRPEVHLHPAEGSAMSAACHDVVQSPVFEIGIAFAIIANIAVIATEHFRQSGTWTSVQLYLNTGFAAVFVAEAVLKILAHRNLYFRIGWNRFDFLLAILGVLGAGLDFFAGDSFVADQTSLFALLRVLRMVRIMRVLRLFKQARNVRILVETLWYSLPSIGNISLFMLIIYFVFAVVGVQTFANVGPGRFLTDDFFNFQSFPKAMALMFVYTTNERWSDAMYDTMNAAEDCQVACGGVAAGVAFHVTFILISAFVMTNLFIAIILDNFATTMRMDSSHLSLAVLHRYTEIWGMLDPEGTMLIDAVQLPRMLAALQPPLGIARRDSRLEVLRRMALYQIPEHSGQVHFVEVLIPLASVASGIELDEREVRRQQEHVRHTFPELLQLPTFRFGHCPVHVGHSLAQSYVASTYRAQRLRRKVEAMYATKLKDLEEYLAAHPDAPEAYRHRLRVLQERQEAAGSVRDLVVEDLSDREGDE